MAHGSCCCCCCLHWIGAATGLIVGGVVAGRAARKLGWPIQPKAKRYVIAGAWFGFLSVPLLVLLAWGAMMTRPSIAAGLNTFRLGQWAEFALIGLAFGPSLAAIPVGIGALLGGLLARPFERAAAAPLLNGLLARPPEQAAAASGGETPHYAMRLAWRIAWCSVLFSTLFSGIGYLIMLLIAFPLGVK